MFFQVSPSTDPHFAGISEKGAEQGALDEIALHDLLDGIVQIHHGGIGGKDRNIRRPWRDDVLFSGMSLDGKS